MQKCGFFGNPQLAHVAQGPWTDRARQGWADGVRAPRDGGNASRSALLLELIRRPGIGKATEPLPQPPSTPRGSAKPRIPLAGLVFLRAASLPEHPRDP
jgi:hypothetical protein